MYAPFTILWRDILVSWRGVVGELAATIASPLTFFLTFGLGLRGYILDIEGVPYLVFMVPGLISMAVMNEAFDHAAWSLWFHRKIQGTIDEYRVSPITTQDVVVGKILSGFGVGLARGIVVGLIMFALTGVRIPLAHLASYMFFLVLGSIVFSCAGTIVGTLFDQPAHLGRIQVIVVQPLIFLAGLFFPITAFPAWLLPWIRLLPTTAIFEGSRHAFIHGSVDLVYVANLSVSSLLTFWLAVWIFNRYIEP